MESTELDRRLERAFAAAMSQLGRSVGEVTLTLGDGTDDERADALVKFCNREVTERAGLLVVAYLDRNKHRIELFGYSKGARGPQASTCLNLPAAVSFWLDEHSRGVARR